MKNIEFIKMIFSQMTADEMIDFCGGDCCENVLCKFTGHKCFGTDNCGECLRTFLASDEHRMVEEWWKNEK